MSNGNNGNSSARRKKFGTTEILPPEVTMDTRSLQKATEQTVEEKEKVRELIASINPIPYKTGKPPMYDPYKHPMMAYMLCKEFGAIDLQLCELFGITEDGLYGWKKQHEEFAKALVVGKDMYNTRHVERRLLDRAMGYSYKETKTTSCKIGQHEIGAKEITITTKHIPPDPKCLFFFLTNRDYKRWKSVNHVVTHPSEDGSFQPQDINKVDMNALGEGDLDELERIIGAAHHRGRTISAESADAG